MPKAGPDLQVGARFLARLTLAASLAALACGDSGGSGEAAGAAGSAAAQASWTVLVYAHADHNLSPSLAADIDEMSRATLAPGVQVIVAADWNGSVRRPDGERYPKGTEWLRIVGGGKPAERIKLDPEQTFDDPATLTKVISEGFSSFPAPRRALILWDHGGSWNGGFGGDREDGLRPAGSTRPMELPAMAEALAQGFAGAGLPARHGVDLLGVDACLMGSVEVAYALREATPVYIGSAEIDYGDGWDYEAFLTTLSSAPEASAADIARQEVAQWGAHHQQRVDDAYLRAQAAIDTERLEALAASVRALGEAAAKQADALAPLLSRQLLFSVPGYGGSVGGAARRSGYRDLRQLVEGTAAGAPEIAAELSQAASALGDAVIASSVGELRQGQGALHIGLPGADDPSGWFEAYPRLASEWDKASAWSTLVAAVASRRDTTPPELSVTLSGQGTPTPGQPFQIRLSSPSPDVFGAMVEAWAEGADGSREALGVVGATALSPGQEASVPWAGLRYELDQTETATPGLWILAWQAADQAPGRSLVAVDGVVEQPDQEPLDAKLLFVATQPEATTLVLEQDGLARAFDARKVTSLYPGASFRPRKRTEVSPGQVQESLRSPVPFADGHGPAATPRPLAPGRYALRVRALDVWGNPTEKEVVAEIGGAGQ